MFRFTITGGRCYNPAAHAWTERDLYLEGGKIVKELSGKCDHLIDASGCLVLPGLIDYHVHYYQGATENGVNADASSFCNGITTAVDGGSIGAGGYSFFRNTVMSLSQVRLRGCLLIASGGQSNDRYPENLDPALFDEEKILSLFKAHSDTLVGLKTRISRNIISSQMVEASIRRTVDIAQKAGTRVVVHVTDCPIPLSELAAMLRPGDVICHIYQGVGDNTCLNEKGEVHAGLWEARKRGVLFDACQGRSNFDLTVAEPAIRQGFTPDIISSDNNVSSWFLPPMEVLPKILSKYVDFGMKLEDVLDAVTLRPAELIGRCDLASLEEGTPADIALFAWKEKKVLHQDKAGHTYQGSHILVPQMTFKGGTCVYRQADF